MPASDTSGRDPDSPSQADEMGGIPRRWHVVLLVRDVEQPGEQPDEQTAIKTVLRSELDTDPNFATEVLVDDRIIAIFYHAGDWFAIDGMCAHQGGPLAEGVVRDGCVTCPWHGWQYDLASGVEMINRQPLQESFPIREVEDRVEVFV